MDSSAWPVPPLVAGTEPVWYKTLKSLAIPMTSGLDLTRLESLHDLSVYEINPHLRSHGRRLLPWMPHLRSLTLQLGKLPSKRDLTVATRISLAQLADLRDLRLVNHHQYATALLFSLPAPGALRVALEGNFWFHDFSEVPAFCEQVSGNGREGGVISLSLRQVYVGPTDIEVLAPMPRALKSLEMLDVHPRAFQRLQLQNRLDECRVGFSAPIELDRGFCQRLDAMARPWTVRKLCIASSIRIDLSKDYSTGVSRHTKLELEAPVLRLRSVTNCRWQRRLRKIRAVVNQQDFQSRTSHARPLRQVAGKGAPIVRSLHRHADRSSCFPEALKYCKRVRTVLIDASI